MGKYYYCDLLQVSKQQGYTGWNDGGKNLTGEMQGLIYGTHNRDISDCNFGKIIVEFTANPFIVREIITKMNIPLLYCVKKTEYNDISIWQRYLFGKVHTFARILKVITPSYNCNTGLKEVKKAKELEEYLEEKDFEAWNKELETFFNKGKEKMKNRIFMENQLKINETEEKRMIHGLAKKINSKK